MYQNPHSAGYSVLRKTSLYRFESQNEISASMSNNIPEYAGMFYHPTEHEVISSIKYRNENPGYDAGFREIQEAMQGTPLEFYIPRSVAVEDGIGMSKNVEIINPFKEVSDKINKGIINEIKKAQDEVKGKTFILRDVEIEDTLVLRRKIRKRDILIRSKDI